MEPQLEDPGNLKLVMNYLLLAKWYLKCFDNLLKLNWNEKVLTKGFFEEIWNKKKLRFKGVSSLFDPIDKFSSMLACASLHSKSNIFFSFPDSRPQRPTALTASSLLLCSYSALKSTTDGGVILYFGAKIGLRSHFDYVSFSGNKLSSIFYPQEYKSKVQDSIEYHRELMKRLPSLICVYSPIDPISICKEYRPKWAALDCSYATETDRKWILPLIEYFAKNKIPFISWTSNPLSSLEENFKSVGSYIFKWPCLDYESTLNTKKKEDLDFLVDLFTKSKWDASITPYLILGKTAILISEHLGKGQRALAEAMSLSSDRLSNDSLSVGWKYLRALERLAIPIELYESESVHYWGVFSLEKLCRSFEQFVSHAQRAGLRIIDKLELSKHHLDFVFDILTKNDTPRWSALINLILEDTPTDFARILVFPSASQKSMFLYTLLARENTTEKDLVDMGIWLLPFKEVTRLLESKGNYLRKEKTTSRINDDLDVPPFNKEWNILIVSVPPKVLTDKMTPFLLSKKFDVLLYPHQLQRLNKFIKVWNNSFGHDLENNMHTLSKLSHTVQLDNFPKGTINIVFNDSKKIEVESTPDEYIRKLKSIWEPLSDQEEFFMLSLDERDDLPLIEDQVLLDPDTHREDDELLYVERAVEVNFEDHWYGIFAFDSKLNVVKHEGRGKKIESRFVRSLRPGDRVLYISGQKRQSLYDLILSRIHNHPSIEIHLALIHQWQREIKEAYSIWRKKGKTLFDLFEKMKESGSSLETPAAFRLWIIGMTLRPRDRDDLRRVAEILEMPFTLKHNKRIHSAGDRIHGLHISVSLRLNEWLREGSSGTEYSSQVIDESTGLTLDDLRNSMMLLVVSSTKEIEGLFERYNLGKIERRQK